MNVEAEKRHARKCMMMKVYAWWVGTSMRLLRCLGKKERQDFPDMDDQLHKYHGFVISGSSYNAYGNDLWILRLCFLLQTLDAMEKKVLGICFGH
ncbi:hypothetical protein HHK36_013708 [Tetracentron sinense]|uniref:Uncharacterized protein n=1 Tax=Tetracentron sinense TaxID=13715 RepID=A0A834Z6T4_TETSI|nr:hypothetical protein HHK36_013708 [Tetracentron sinense]